MYNRPIVVFIGARTIITAAQVQKLIATRSADEIQLGKGVAAKALKALRKNRHLVIPIHWKADEEWYLSYEIPPLFGECIVHGWMATGRNTASCVFGAMDAIGIRLDDQILTRISRGRLVGGEADGLSVCTKTGGFGDEDALVTIVDFLVQQNSL